MSWLERRRPKKTHAKQPIKLVNFNDYLKRLDREGKLEAYMAAWTQYEQEREAAP